MNLIVDVNRPMRMNLQQSVNMKNIETQEAAMSLTVEEHLELQGFGWSSPYLKGERHDLRKSPFFFISASHAPRKRSRHPTTLSFDQSPTSFLHLLHATITNHASTNN